MLRRRFGPRPRRARLPRLAALGAVLTLGLTPAALRAEAPPAAPASVLVRGGDHRDFSRVVFNWPSRVTYALVRDGDRLRLQFDQAARFDIRNRATRTIRSITAAGTAAEIEVAPGTQIRAFREGTAVVVDVADAPRGAPARPARAAGPAPMTVTPPPHPSSMAGRGTEAPPAPPGAPREAAAEPIPVPTPPSVAEAVAPPPAPPAASPPPPAPPAATLLSGAAQAGPPAGALRVQPVAGTAGPGLLIPFAGPVGAAALHRGDHLLVVFDQPQDLDLGALQGHPLFGEVVATRTPTATVLQFRLAPPTSLQLSRRDRHWLLEAVREPPALLGIALQPSAAPVQLALAAAMPGRVVHIVDPLTDNLLLIGTQTEPGQGLGLARRYREFSLLPTLQGVAVLPRSDDLVLRLAEDGFAVATGVANPAGLVLSAAPARPVGERETAILSRAFDLPRLPVEALWTALRAQTEAAATAPPLARAQPRMQAAETLLALGLGHEAQALLRLAATEDPRVAQSPRLLGLSGVAALLAGRLAEAGTLADPRLAGNDEVALWRALLRATEDAGAPDAATALAPRLPLLLSYPTPLRARIAPLAAETLALAGALAAAEQVIAELEGDPALDLARAMILEGRGDAAGAERLYASVAKGRDRRQRARAAVRRIELQHRRGDLDAGAAAEALAQQLDSWRGDAQELALRVRIADLRCQAGAWREALALLQETAELFPEQRGRVQAERAATFTAMVRAGRLDALPAAEFVTLVEAHVDLLPGGAPDAALAARIAERLIALDLPGRADPLLARLAAEAAEPMDRARFGAQLAAARLQDGKAAAALAALAQTAPPAGTPLAAPLAEERGLLYARAEAMRGERARAVQILREIGTPAADELRARLLWAAADWPGATAALADLAQKTLPPPGAALPAPARQVLVRLATAASLAGDAALLARLRTERAAQLGTDSLADIVRLLTNGPLTGLEDLPVLAGELALLRRFGSDAALRPVPAETP